MLPDLGMLSGVPTPFLLLGAGCFLLVALGVSGAVLLRQIELHRRVEGRVARVAQSVVRPRSLRAGSIARSAAAERRDAKGWAGWVFGFDPARPDLCPVRWWVVLAVGFIPGWIAAQVAAGLLGPPALFLLPAVWLTVCRLYFRRCAERVRHQLLLQFPDALAMMVRAIRVGIPVAGGMRAVAQQAQSPTREEFAALHNQILIGVPLDEGLRAMAQHTTLAEYRFFATAVSLQSQTGGVLTEVMENLAEVIRRRVAMQARGRALSAEARASAVVLAVMPILTGGLIHLINPGYMAPLFSEPIGRKLLGGALVSLALGGWTMRSLIRKALA